MLFDLFIWSSRGDGVHHRRGPRVLSTLLTSIALSADGQDIGNIRAQQRSPNGSCAHPWEIPAYRWMTQIFCILESSTICSEFLRFQDTKCCTLKCFCYSAHVFVVDWILSHRLHCTFPSITKEIAKTGDANLIDHLTGAHGDSADAVSVQLPWSQWIVQPSNGRLYHSKYNRKVVRPFPEVTYR